MAHLGTLLVRQHISSRDFLIRRHIFNGPFYVGTSRHIFNGPSDVGTSVSNGRVSCGVSDLGLNRTPIIYIVNLRGFRGVSLLFSTPKSALLGYFSPHLTWWVLRRPCSLLLCVFWSCIGRFTTLFWMSFFAHIAVRSSCNITRPMKRYHFSDSVPPPPPPGYNDLLSGTRRRGGTYLQIHACLHGNWWWDMLMGMHILRRYLTHCYEMTNLSALWLQVFLYIWLLWSGMYSYCYECVSLILTIHH